MQAPGEDNWSTSSPAYDVLERAGALTTEYLVKDFEACFTGSDVRANSSQDNDMKERCMYGYYFGCCAFYFCTHAEIFVPAGHVGLLMDEKNDYLLASPGMHNIRSCFTRVRGPPKPINRVIEHGDRTIVTVDQGNIGFAMDNGMPVLLPQGIHCWTSDSLHFVKMVPLSDHVVALGPYTILTVDEGYAAVTQNNGKQMVMPGGHCHFLDHKNWKFQKFMSTKIQTDDLPDTLATSADNIEMLVKSTVNWRIKDVLLAATMAEGTMAVSGRVSDADTSSKTRKDVIKQCLASLSGFIGSVNYSTTFENSAADTAAGRATAENPIFDRSRIATAVDHANRVTMTYGVEVSSINVISATPCDMELQRALASGAVASASALQAETAARGNARAIAIRAQADADKLAIQARGEAESVVIEAKGASESETVRAQGALEAANLLSTSEVAVDLAKMDRSAAMLNGGEKYFFGQEPSMLSNVFTKKSI
mmetsp:Transcript_19411/g.44016  ORF Transcript_19411/g.44016 Transcript_19411/m.44016 type:complete len:481 (+) Transcript_19411:271-1713(+)